MRRRALLSAFPAAIASALAGCAGGDGTTTETLTPADVPTGRRPTPTGTPTVACPALPSNAEVYVCSPTAPGENALRLGPSSRVYEAGNGGLAFTLHNDTGLAFRTGRDQWTLARRDRAGWSIVDQGDGSDRLVVGPGESFVWEFDAAAGRDVSGAGRGTAEGVGTDDERRGDGLGASAYDGVTTEPPADGTDTGSTADSADPTGTGTSTAPPEVARPAVSLGGGPHALSVTGYVTGGELTAVVAPFRVRPDFD